MNVQKLAFLSSGSRLVGNLTVAQSPEVGVLILHGGGTASKERYSELQEFLVNQGFSSLAFDFVGVGESEGKFEEGSLVRRLGDARHGYAELANYVSRVVVLGCSMGGHVAARLASCEPDVPAAILLYPAAYGVSSEDKPLNESFTLEIRKEHSWQDSSAFAALENYRGQLLVLYGALDTVIPSGVQESFRRLVGSRGKFLVLPEAHHHLLRATNEQEMRTRARVYHEVVTFLTQIHRRLDAS